MAGEPTSTAELDTLRARVAALSAALDAAAAREVHLRESEARFRILAEESLAGVYVIQDRKFAYVNERAASLFGMTREDIVGHEFDALVAPESLPVVEENIRRRLQGEVQSMRYCLKVRHRNGEIRECEVLGSVADWGGRPAIVGTVLDRTDELQRQAQLEDQTRILQLILDCMGDGVAVTDANGEFIIFNPAARRITGLGPMGHTPEEWADAYGIFTPGGLPFPAADLPLARAMRGESTDDVELFLRQPDAVDGAWIQVTGRPLVDAGGEMHGGVVVFHDITGRKRMIEQLQRAETAYRSLVEQLPIIVYTAHPDADANVFYVSPQVQSILGFEPQEWTSDPGLWSRQVHPEDRERAMTEARRCRESGEKLVCEYRMFARDGRLVWIHDEAVLLRHADGQPRVVQGLMLDVSEREQERSGRKRLQALSQDLVTVQEGERRRIGLELHDDIGQVLTGLRLRLLAMRGMPPQEVAAALRDAQALADEAIASVRELSQSLRPAVLDDLGLLPALISHVDRWSRQTQIQVHLEHRGVERRRFGAEAETAAYRIVQEALTNVVRHSNATAARVRAIARNGTLHVEIEDEGEGFDSSGLAADRVMHGLGGMRERLALLGGKLSVDAAPGRGCRLQAEIPLSPAPPSVEA